MLCNYKLKSIKYCVEFDQLVRDYCNYYSCQNLHLSMQKSYRRSQVKTAVSNVYTKNLIDSDFGNTFCWFWVDTKDYENHPYGCSPVATCNAGI